MCVWNKKWESLQLLSLSTFLCKPKIFLSQEREGKENTFSPHHLMDGERENDEDEERRSHGERDFSHTHLYLYLLNSWKKVAPIIFLLSQYGIEKRETPLISISWLSRQSVRQTETVHIRWKGESLIRWMMQGGRGEDLEKFPFSQGFLLRRLKTSFLSFAFLGVLGLCCPIYTRNHWRRIRREKKLAGQVFLS